MRKDSLVPGEYAKHLRPYGKRKQAKAERAAAKEMIDDELSPAEIVRAVRTRSRNTVLTLTYTDAYVAKHRRNAWAMMYNNDRRYYHSPKDAQTAIDTFRVKDPDFDKYYTYTITPKHTKLKNND